MAKYLQGRFKPKNKAKYMGDANNVIYRSSWELKLMRRLDEHPEVIKWGSEEVIIPYRCPFDKKKIRRYFTDFIVKKKDKNGNISTLIIEVKPKKQTKKPDKSKAKTPTGKFKKSFLREVKDYQVNQAKWKAAQSFCADRKWQFMIMTEDHLGV